MPCRQDARCRGVHLQQDATPCLHHLSGCARRLFQSHRRRKKCILVSRICSFLERGCRTYPLPRCLVATLGHAGARLDSSGLADSNPPPLPPPLFFLAQQSVIPLRPETRFCLLIPGWCGDAQRTAAAESMNNSRPIVRLTASACRVMV